MSHDLDNFLFGLYPGAATKTSGFDVFSASDIGLIYGTPAPHLEAAEKLAHDAACFLEQFEGTPLHAKAIALVGEELQLEAERIQRDEARRAQAEPMDDSWSKQRMLDLKKRQLELELHKAKAQHEASEAPEQEIAEHAEGVPAPMTSGGVPAKTAALKVAVSDKWIAKHVFQGIQRRAHNAALKAYPQHRNLILEKIVTSTTGPAAETLKADAIRAGAAELNRVRAASGRSGVRHTVAMAKRGTTPSPEDLAELGKELEAEAAKRHARAVRLGVKTEAARASAPAAAAASPRPSLPRPSTQTSAPRSATTPSAPTSAPRTSAPRPGTQTSAPVSTGRTSAPKPSHSHGSASDWALPVAGGIATLGGIGLAAALHHHGAKDSRERKKRAADAGLASLLKGRQAESWRNAASYLSPKDLLGKAVESGKTQAGGMSRSVATYAPARARLHQLAAGGNTVAAEALKRGELDLEKAAGLQDLLTRLTTTRAQRLAKMDARGAAALAKSRAASPVRSVSDYLTKKASLGARVVAAAQRGAQQAATGMASRAAFPAVAKAPPTAPNAASFLAKKSPYMLKVPGSR